MNPFEAAIETIVDTIGDPATIKIAGVARSINAIFLNEMQKQQLASVQFEGGEPVCLIKSADGVNAKSNRDQIKITDVNNNQYYNIRKVLPNSKGGTLLILSED